MNNACAIALRGSWPCGSLFSASPWKLAAKIATGRPLSSLTSCRHSSAASNLIRYTNSNFQPLSLQIAIPRPSPRPVACSIGIRTAKTSSRTPKPKKAAAKPPPSDPKSRYNEGRDIPLPKGDLNNAEIRNIFGKDLSQAAGNRLLRILQHRRESGLLGDIGISFDASSKYAEKQALAGIEYLRKHYPIDEEAAAAVWAEEELKRLEREQLIQRAERLGLYKRSEGESTAAEGNVYGASGIDALHQYYEERYHEEKKLKEEEERKRQEQEMLEIGEKAKEAQRKWTQVEPAARRAELTEETSQTKWWHKYRDKAEAEGLKQTPDMTTFQRLFPSTVLTIVVLGLLGLYAYTYEPPPHSARLVPELPPAAATLYFLVASNILVFVAWRFPPFWTFMNRYFIQVPGYPYAVSNLLNVFSHVETKHFLINMGFVLAIGPYVHDIIGRGNFLALYMASGLLGSYASLVSQVLRRNFATSSNGASGALCGLIAAACLFPIKSHVSPPFTDWSFPLRTDMFFAVLLLVEGLSLRRNLAHMKMDHFAHLGGYVTGVIASMLLAMQREGSLFWYKPGVFMREDKDSEENDDSEQEEAKKSE